MKKLNLSLTALFLTAVISSAQNKDLVTPTIPTGDVNPTLITIEDDDWYNSGIWKTDKDLSQLYADIHESVRNSMPVDPAIQEASNVLSANRKTALFEKANEIGITLDENGGLIAGQIDKSEWYIIIEPIEKEYSIANSRLWESWREAFQIRFEEAFVEAARNLKLNAEKMK